ncbi:hypothetical protein DH2020_006745 [Rehmannia glutinosa]|uniref:Methyltransferase domain-containing protein n=1 Tax=Rehmannia glutinosa TaxID=99300 RepID=A0ABR0XJV6_REHGL
MRRCSGHCFSVPRPPLLVLEVGCGNSQLCEELYRDGITELTCIDLSSIAVEKMKQRLLSKGCKGLNVGVHGWFSEPHTHAFNIWNSLHQVGSGTIEGNHGKVIMYALTTPSCRDTSPGSTSFTSNWRSDVLFVDSGDPWNPEPVTVSKVMAMLENVHRVLKPHGMFISITFGQPHFRRPFFNAPTFTWSVEWRTFGDGFHYFFYILKKGERSSDNTEYTEKIDMPSITLFHEELDNEDYIFRTNLDDM